MMAQFRTKETPLHLNSRRTSSSLSLSLPWGFVGSNTTSAAESSNCHQLQQEIARCRLWYHFPRFYKNRLFSQSFHIIYLRSNCRFLWSCFEGGLKSNNKIVWNFSPFIAYSDAMFVAHSSLVAWLERSVLFLDVDMNNVMCSYTVKRKIVRWIFGVRGRSYFSCGSISIIS